MKPRLGLALGGGAAKGWSHFGVLRVLSEVGLAPDIVAGTSIGALVGGAYAAGYHKELEDWVSSLRWQEVLAMMDLRFSGGLLHGEKVIDHLRQGMQGIKIEDLQAPAFAAVATDVDNGHEIWLRNGELLSAIRASIALPGLFSPVRRQGRWLVDGGVVNPTPISVCRAMGADVVIAVDLTALPVFRLVKKLATNDERSVEMPLAGLTDNWRSADKFFGLLQGVMGRMQTQKGGEDETLPSTLDVMVRSLNIMLNRAARSRIAGEPPDLLISPAVEHIALMEFHRAKEAIKIGQDAANRFRPELERIKQYLG